MFIENTTGDALDTNILDDNYELIKMVHKVEWLHEAGQLPVATIYCHKPTIRAKVNGRYNWKLGSYSREQKESLYKALELELNK
jgi:hypothetical protein